MIDEAWPANCDGTGATGRRDGTIAAGLAGVVALIASGCFLGGVDLIGRRFSRQFGRHPEEPRRPADWYDELIRGGCIGSGPQVRRQGEVRKVGGPETSWRSIPATHSHLR